ncbi:MAG: cation diffusion facilitator family transporter [Francisellaceae bacterium]|jgi:cation diffusion facilitator family transporter
MNMQETDRYQESKRVTITGAWINLSLALIKISVGLIGRSPALFADGIHSLSDLISDFFVLFAAKVANKGVDYNHPYGHQRIETLATIGLSFLLIAVGSGIAYDAISHLISGTIFIPDKYTIVAAIISILANEWLFRHTLKTADKIGSDLLRANAWHSRSDALSSIVVLVGLIGSFLGFPIMDAIAAIIVCLMIIKMGVTWTIQSFSELVDTGLDKESIAKIEAAILSTDGVKDFHLLRTRKMAGKAFLDVHVLVDGEISASEGHHIGEHTRANINSSIDDIEDITVHIDVDNHPEGIPKPEQLAPLRRTVIDKLMPHWEKIIKKSNIQKIDLKYLNGKIQISLFLYEPNLNKDQINTLINELEKTAAHLKKVSDIKVFIEAKI